MLPRWRWAAYTLPVTIGLIPAFLAPGHIVGDGVDAYGTGWFYWWVRMCVTHFGDPSWTSLFFMPDGKDIFSHTGNNFIDAVFSLPFQWVFGLNWSPPFTLFLLAGNAWAFEKLALELWSDPREAVAATVAWMVCPYAIFELTAGRPTQACLWWAPLAVLMLLRICRGDASTRTALSLGAAVAIAAWTYWFVGYFLAFLMLPLAIWWSDGRRAQAARSVGIAAVFCVVLILPMGLAMWGSWDAGLVPGVKAGGPEAANVSGDLHGIWLMETRGAPLLLQPAWTLAAMIGALRGGREGRIWALIAIGLIAIGFGARISGERILNPVWLVASHLPFLSRLWFPYRITMVVMIPMVALAILAWRSLGRSPRWGMTFVAGSIGGQLFAGTLPFNHTDTTCPPLIVDAAKEPGAFLFLPGGIQSDVLLWQTQFARPTIGGMGESAPAMWPDGYRKRRGTPWMTALQNAAAAPLRPQPRLPSKREELDALGVRWVVLRRDLIVGVWRNERRRNPKTPLNLRDSEAIRLLTSLLGAPQAADERLVLWDVKGTYSNPAFTATEALLTAPPRDEEVRPGFELGMIRMGREQ